MLLFTIEFLKDCLHEPHSRLNGGWLLNAPTSSWLLNVTEAAMSQLDEQRPSPPPPPRPSSPPPPWWEDDVECMSSHYWTLSSYFAPLTVVAVLLPCLSPCIKICCQGSSEARSEDGNQEFIDAEGRREAAIVDAEGRREAEDDGERAAAIPATPEIAMSSV